MDRSHTMVMWEDKRKILPLAVHQLVPYAGEVGCAASGKWMAVIDRVSRPCMKVEVMDQRQSQYNRDQYSKIRTNTTESRER